MWWQVPLIMHMCKIFLTCVSVFVSEVDFSFQESVCAVNIFHAAYLGSSPNYVRTGTCV